MKGRDSFTTREIEKIKELLEEKVQVTPAKQKGIRQKIRKIGFYISDFGWNEWALRSRTWRHSSSPDKL